MAQPSASANAGSASGLRSSLTGSAWLRLSLLLDMPLFPKTTKDWTRSLASALLGGCAIVWLVVLWCLSGSIDHRIWRYAGPSIGGLLLPSLGLSLGLVCLTGRAALSKGFLKSALIAAVVSVVLGFLLSPALAE
jgi:hypothetical protein